MILSNKTIIKYPHHHPEKKLKDTKNNLNNNNNKIGQHHQPISIKSGKNQNQNLR